MHELGIVQSTLDCAVKSARASGATRIHILRMRVGVLTGIVPETLTFAFEVARQGTMAEEAVLEIESVPVSCWCADCQKEFSSPDLLYECPQCHQASYQLRKGRELEIVSIEIS
jgi:hydrogenase nickel incorporation protein HypA/HybF